MRSLAILSFFVASTLSSTAQSQTADTVFLTCETVREYEGADQGHVVPEVLHFKVDFKASNVMEFDADKGRYESMCPNNSNDIKNTDHSGKCELKDDVVYADSKKLMFALTEMDTIFIYRNSGRISGSRAMYAGRITDVVELLKSKKVVEFKVRGTCQKGADMGQSKKAF